MRFQTNFMCIVFSRFGFAILFEKTCAKSNENIWKLLFFPLQRYSPTWNRYESVLFGLILVTSSIKVRIQALQMRDFIENRGLLRN